jgi:hypothetical protein
MGFLWVGGGYPPVYRGLARMDIHHGRMFVCQKIAPKTVTELRAD